MRNVILLAGKSGLDGPDLEVGEGIKRMLRLALNESLGDCRESGGRGFGQYRSLQELCCDLKLYPCEPRIN